MPHAYASTVLLLPVDEVAPNPQQPRRVFAEEELAELAESIRQVGVLSPILVRETPDGWQLVAGERRLRACKLAGVGKVPALPCPPGTSDAVLALVENIQRENLNSLEECLAYHRLAEEMDLTHEGVAQLVGKSRSHVSSTMRLRELPETVQRKVASGVLTAGHAKVLARVRDPIACERLAVQAVAEGLSVRMLEERVLLGDLSGAEGEEIAPARRRSRVKPADPQSFLERSTSLSAQLEERLETRVRVMGSSRRGRLVIDFSGELDFERVAHALGCNLEGSSTGVVEEPS